MSQQEAPLTILENIPGLPNLIDVLPGTICGG